MAQIKFLSSNCHAKFEIEDYFWIEFEMGGKSFRLDVGKHGKGHDPARESIHINGPFDLEVDHHSVNALDVFPCPKNSYRGG